MGKKLCPLGFFSFYINKESAQAGGSLDCVEDSCAIWDETCQQCSIKSGFEALSLIADFISSEDIKVSKESPISDILTRLRMKRKINEEQKSQPVVSETTEIKAVIPPTIIHPTIVPPKIEPPSDITVAPKVPISELPVVSINDSKVENSEVKNG